MKVSLEMVTYVLRGSVATRFALGIQDAFHQQQPSVSVNKDFCFKMMVPVVI